jgi:hypothetical protein
MKFNIPTLLAKTAIIDTIAIRVLVRLERYYFLHRELPKTDQDRAVFVNRRGKSSRTIGRSFFDVEGRRA